MWIDTHCHLDAPEFDRDRSEVLENAQQAGIEHIVIPAIHADHFEQTIALGSQKGCSFALGIHPLWMGNEMQASEQSQEAEDRKVIQRLKEAIESQINNPHLIAMGELGLDYFVPNLSPKRQWFYYVEQLKLAKHFNLPVILHLRRSADMLLKGIRENEGVNGIVHAFNGSFQQAEQFIQFGFKLGFGGAATYEQARNIRNLLKNLPLESIVLETDAPDMPPYWLYKTALQRQQGMLQGRNEPKELAKIAQELASVKNMAFNDFAAEVKKNTLQALPKLVGVL